MTPRDLATTLEDGTTRVAFRDDRLVVLGKGKTELDQQATKLLLAGPATVPDGPAPGVHLHELHVLTAWDERLALGAMSPEDHAARVRGLVERKERSK